MHSGSAFAIALDWDCNALRFIRQSNDFGDLGLAVLFSEEGLKLSVDLFFISIAAQRLHFSIKIISNCLFCRPMSIYHLPRFRLIH